MSKYLKEVENIVNLSKMGDKDNGSFELLECSRKLISVLNFGQSNRWENVRSNGLEESLFSSLAQPIKDALLKCVDPNDKFLTLILLPLLMLQESTTYAKNSPNPIIMSLAHIAMHFLLDSENNVLVKSHSNFVDFLLKEGDIGALKILVDAFSKVFTPESSLFSVNFFSKDLPNNSALVTILSSNSLSSSLNKEIFESLLSLKN